MKTEFADVNETRKTVRVEIPTEMVAAEIDRVAKDYSRKARIPGFRPGKAPAKVINQRFKEQIVHDVLHDLVPRAVDDALRERGVEAVDTPDVRDVNIEEGQPLTFTASFDTLPAFDPGDLSTIPLANRGSPEGIGFPGNWLLRANGTPIPEPTCIVAAAAMLLPCARRRRRV